MTMLAISGCDLEELQDPHELEAEHTLTSLADWRAREAPYAHQDAGIVDIGLAREIQQDVYEKIDYNNDKKDLWHFQDSAETELIGSGVCIDRAILVYMRLREAGFPDDCVGLMEFHRPGRSENNVVAAVFPADDKSEYIALGPVDDDSYPVQGYSLFDFWIYPGPS